MARPHSPPLSPMDRALLATYIDERPAPVAKGEGCCDGFRRGVFAASLHDPRCCIRCAPIRYGWKRAPFGKIRRVPPGEAQRWRD